ncbi:MAG: O-antigen ligase family protein [Verrucomicrobiae bacterium]|nr:O-antigen ligase family protein [Verrucomicrobiae bacterium]NNJ42521.1 O-antigen ligase family protein [Akkermansiaceae bacterium]
MNNKALAILIIPVFLVIALWLTSSMATLNPYYQIYTVAGVLLFSLTLFAGRRISYDVKFLIFLLLGYAFGGKGFAYVTPFEPFYVGEFCMCICLLLLVFRMKLFIAATRGHGQMIWVLMICMISLSGLRLLFFDFQVYRMLAIRDSSTAYYGLFFIVSYVAMEKDANFRAMKKVLPWCCALALLSATLAHFKVHLLLMELHPYMGNVFFPHQDTTKPFLAALLVSLSVLIIQKKKLTPIPVCFVVTAILLLGQTSGVVALIFAYAFLFLTTHRKEFLMLGIGGVFLALVAVGVIAISASTGDSEYLGKDHVETFQDIQDFDTRVNNDNTTSWRLGWWRTIWDETMDYSPLFGQGFGADLSGEFQEITEVESVARYPHNVAFTVIGRMGLIGLFAFMTLISIILLHLRRGAIMILRGGELDYHFLLAITFVLAGIANGFLQMTYEGPYAAIPHWVVLGYVFAYIRRYRIGRLEV